MAEPVLTDAEMERLVLSLARSRGSKQFTEDDARVVLDWATDQRIGMAMLRVVLEGEVDIDVQNGEVMLKRKEP